MSCTGGKIKHLSSKQIRYLFILNRKAQEIFKADLILKRWTKQYAEIV